MAGRWRESNNAPIRQQPPLIIAVAGAPMWLASAPAINPPNGATPRKAIA